MMQVIFPYLEEYADGPYRHLELWHGECPYGGVDAYVAAYGYGRGWKVVPFPPKPSGGRTALYPRDYAIRDQAMVDAGPDMVLGFFLKGAKNRGTRLTIDMAKTAKLPYREIWA
jgi:hypothetical protein